MTIRRQVGILGAALLFSVAAVPMLFAQGQEAGPSPSETGPGKHKTSLKAEAPSEVDAGTKASEGSRMGLMGRFQGDQREIWTSPARIRFSDTEWLVPLSGITAGLFVTDHDFSKHLSQNPTTTSHYKTLSNAGVAALVGGAGGMWLLGNASHKENWSE